MTESTVPPNTDDDDLERAAEHIERPIASLVGDYEEDVRAKRSSIDDVASGSKGVYWLPNLLTTGALFAGFYAVIAGMQGDFYAGAVAIFVAGMLDGLDGRVARLTKTTSAFGAEYDSLADMVSFGVAPALLMFNPEDDDDYRDRAARRGVADGAVGGAAERRAFRGALGAGAPRPR